VKGTLIWDNDDKTILRHCYTANLTAADVIDMACATYDLLMSVPHIVHIIIELPGLTRASQVQIMEAADQLDDCLAPNQGYSVTVGGGLAMAYAVKTMAKVAPRSMERAHFADTLDEARALIKRLETAQK
jgi:hypothetical protein